MDLMDVKLTDQVSRHEIDGHEIGRQDIYRLKIDYITMQHAILSKTKAEHKSQQQSKLYHMLMHNNVEMHQILQKHQPKISYR